MAKALKNVNVAVLAADGVEQVEVSVPLRALRKAGARIRLVSLRPGRIRSVNFIWRGKKIPVDDTVFTADPDDFGALLLPGGFVNPDLLRQSSKAKEFVAAFERARKPIAVICHGAWTLASAGLVRGRKLTTWPGIADDIKNAGGDWENVAVVRDGNWVSSRGPQDLASFCPAMVSLFAQLAERQPAKPPRRFRWVASLMKAASLAAAGLITVRVARRLAA